MAEPNDWWFHADGVPGSHVILRARPDAEPGRETLAPSGGCRGLSQQSAQRRCYWRFTAREARYVKKPRGIKTGTVQVAKGTVLKVRPDISFAVRVGG